MNNPTQKATDMQVGGTHYKDTAIQPIEFINSNGMDFFEGSAVKYITRWRKKGGHADLDKAIHFLQLLKQFNPEPAERQTGLNIAVTMDYGNGGVVRSPAPVPYTPGERQCIAHIPYHFPPRPFAPPGNWQRDYVAPPKQARQPKDPEDM